MFFVVVLPLPFCTEAQGPQHVFVQHGKDLRLDAKISAALTQKTDLFWKFNTIGNIAKCNFYNDSVVFDRYDGRAELFVQNYTLLLKKVQKSDSGDYTAVVVGGQDHMLAEYKVIVQDPVSTVELTMDSSSSDSCNFTVTCSTVDSHISSIFRCDSQYCSQVEKGSLKAKTYSSSLSVYVQQDFVICNHSNQVSWKYNKEKIKSYCKTHSGSESLSDGVPICVVKTAVFSVGLIIMVFAVISVHVMETLKKQK